MSGGKSHKGLGADAASAWIDAATHDREQVSEVTLLKRPDSARG